MTRVAYLTVASLALACCLASSSLSFAADPATQDGVVVSAGGGRLVIRVDGRERAMNIGERVRFLVNGAAGRLEDFARDSKVRVTTDESGNVISITNAAGEKTHTGIVVSSGSGKLVMTTDGKEHSHIISDKVKVMVNGKMGKLEDLSKGIRVQVTTDDSETVTSVSTMDVKM